MAKHIPPSVWQYFTNEHHLTQKVKDKTKCCLKNKSTKGAPSESTTVFDSKIQNIDDLVVEEVVNETFTDQQLLALSDVVLLTKKEKIEFLSLEESQHVYNSISTPLFEKIPQLGSAVLDPIQHIFHSFSSHQNPLVFSSQLLDYANKTSDSILTPILSSFVNYAYELTTHNTPNMSEMHLQCSFVHPLVRGITKSSPFLIPHSSNKQAFENECAIANCRPDYRMDMYHNNGTFDGTVLFGELKPANTSIDGTTCDFHKCAILAKIGLRKFNTNYFMTFNSVGKVIHFYLYDSLSPSLTYALHLYSFEFPTTIDNFSMLFTLLPKLYMLANIFHSLWEDFLAVLKLKLCYCKDKSILSPLQLEPLYLANLLRRALTLPKSFKVYWNLHLIFELHFSYCKP
ncbi:hypothetical protein BD560DRAFT_427013 [Blakeslea trispora]|nr:hypothetical protein BD560DRAFT_427013 [Blakeslea trispora]